MLLPLTPDDPNNKTFRYEGHDIITLQKIVERDYKVPEPQTSQELIGYYARRMPKRSSYLLRSSPYWRRKFAFFENKAFGRWVDLNDSVTVKAMSTPVASYVCMEEFKRVLKALSIAEQGKCLSLLGLLVFFDLPAICGRARSTKPPIASSTWCPCDNDFERAFARFLLLTMRTISSLLPSFPQPFGFSIDYLTMA